MKYTGLILYPPYNSHELTAWRPYGGKHHSW